MVEDCFKKMVEDFQVFSDGLGWFKVLKLQFVVRNPHHTWSILAEKGI